MSQACGSEGGVRETSLEILSLVWPSTPRGEIALVRTVGKSAVTGEEPTLFFHKAQSIVPTKTSTYVKGLLVPQNT